MRFPLYHRPDTLVFLDDDAGYLETLALVMPRDWGVRLFTHADDCLQHLEAQHALWDADVWQHQQILTQWRGGGFLIPQILNYWNTANYRYGLTQTCVVDYAMPAMTGLEFLQQLPAWPANRVLLTGRADELIAVGAFNDGLIGQYVPKQHGNIGKHLIEVLRTQHSKPMQLHDAVWRGALKPEQYAMLQSRDVQSHLRGFLQEKQWLEYVVVPAPFGILALDKYAKAYWLQLELKTDLHSAADLAESTEHGSLVVNSVRNGTHFVNDELLMSLGSDEAPTTLPTFALDSSGNLLGAVFLLPSNLTYGVSYRDYFSSLPPRTIS